MILVDFTGKEILGDSSERKKRVLADLVPFPYDLNDVLNLFIGDDLEKGILVYYVKHTPPLPVLVNQHVVDLSLIGYVFEEP